MNEPAIDLGIVMALVSSYRNARLMKRRSCSGKSD